MGSEFGGIKFRIVCGFGGNHEDFCMGQDWILIWFTFRHSKLNSVHPLNAIVQKQDCLCLHQLNHNCTILQLLFVWPGKPNKRIPAIDCSLVSQGFCSQITKYSPCESNVFVIVHWTTTRLPGLGLIPVCHFVDG